MNSESVRDDTIAATPFEPVRRHVPDDLLGLLSPATVGQLVFEAAKRRDVVTGVPRVTHDLKCWSTVFPYVLSGEKNFEVRRNDRDFQRGDVLLLREWDSAGNFYTGREVRVIVTYVMRGSEKNAAITKGYCVMGIRLFEGSES